ncbi:MAG: acetylornithine transaminase, partial [Pseudomonadota bacterium]
KVPNMDVVNAGYDAHILTVPAAENVVRLLPPLILSVAEVDEGLNRLERAAKQVRAAAKGAA